MRFTRILLITAAAGIVTAAPVSWSQEIEAPTTAGASTPAAVTGNDRYEGYLFLGADGRPLPFQSDEEIEEYLRTASVVSMEKIPVGVTRPRRALLDRDGLRAHAVFKHVVEEKKMVRDPTATGRGKLYLDWRDSYIYDVAAYHVDRMLQMERIPPIVLRRVKGKDGSLQIWLEETITEKTRQDESIKPPEIARFNQQRSTMHLFDNLVANRDANLGNTLIDGNWRLWYIDCTRCFGNSPDLLYPDAITHCDRKLWRALKELDKNDAERVLSPFLGPAEIDALFRRRDRLVDLLQAHIDMWGEDIVLFDQRPPTETAPWVGE
jgi:hypothetical protein